MSDFESELDKHVENDCSDLEIKELCSGRILQIGNCSEDRFSECMNQKSWVPKTESSIHKVLDFKIQIFGRKDSESRIQ